MGDLFHPDVPYEFIDEVFAVMAVCSQHTFLVLTKRPERMHDYIHAPHTNNVVLKHFKRKPDRGERTWPLPNVWIGVTAENQARADERIPILLETPAAVRFVSCEPLLGPIDLGKWLECPTCAESGEIYNPIEDAFEDCPAHFSPLHWIIAGGETGRGARPMHPDWVRNLRDQCQVAGVPFFFKSWGEWAPFDLVTDFYAPRKLIAYDGSLQGEYCGWGCDNRAKRFAQVVRVGKKYAGCLLDGRTWEEYPKDEISKTMMGGLGH
jgi:protein gp37